MHLIRLTAVLALLFAASAYGQQSRWVDLATPANVSADAPEAAARNDAPPPQLIMDTSRAHNDADARECLQFDTNGEIHRCAEKYRSHTGAKIVKTGLKTGKAKSGDAPKSGDAANSAGHPQAPSALAAESGNTPAAAVASSSPTKSSK